MNFFPSALLLLFCIESNIRLLTSVRNEESPVIFEQTTSRENKLCCSFPCQNGGICMTVGFNDYFCDCTGLGYHGKNCEIPNFLTQLKQLILPSRETSHHILTHFPILWNIINSITPLHQKIMRYIYMSRADQIDTPPRFESEHSFVTLDAAFNTSYYGRSLPPVPAHCDLSSGKKQLPDIDVLIEKFFKREKFIPEPHNSNLLFAYYAQHFTHQFFRTNWKSGPGFTLGNEGVDVSHIYGNNIALQRLLRNFTNGKLKSQIINGEEYPPNVKQVPLLTEYPSGTPPEKNFVLGHPFFAILPGLFVFNTIWLREHNRLCDILAKEHPEWDDEELYQTSRLIVLGETIKITVEDYVQHLSQYKLKLTFEPELLHDTSFAYSNRIRVEFNHLYHWHPLFPDGIKLNGEFRSLEKMIYSVDDVLEHGVTAYVEAMVNQRAGALTYHNHPPMLIPVLKRVIQNGRDLRLESLNQYRKKFGLEPFKSFLDLTGDKKIADELEELYGSVEEMEFYPGLMLEKPGESVTPPTMVEIGGPYSVKGLMSNPICSPQYWKPSTFGGETGFNIIKTASLEKLFCENLKEPCPRISFTVPDEEKKNRNNAFDEL